MREVRTASIAGYAPSRAGVSPQIRVRGMTSSSLPPITPPPENRSSTRARTFFATTLVFFAVRLAETPREVKAPARAEAEAIFVVCGCCDASAKQV